MTLRHFQLNLDKLPFHDPWRSMVTHSSPHKPQGSRGGGVSHPRLLAPRTIEQIRLIPVDSGAHGYVYNIQNHAQTRKWARVLLSRRSETEYHVPRNRSHGVPLGPSVTALCVRQSASRLGTEKHRTLPLVPPGAHTAAQSMRRRVGLT